MGLYWLFRAFYAKGIISLAIILTEYAFIAKQVFANEAISLYTNEANKSEENENFNSKILAYTSIAGIQNPVSSIISTFASIYDTHNKKPSRGLRNIQEAYINHYKEEFYNDLPKFLEKVKIYSKLENDYFKGLKD